MRRSRAVALVACAIAVVIGAIQVVAGQQQPTFRGATDVVLIEVVAAGRDGMPLAGLERDQFQVTFDGRRREVVSADLIRVASPPGVAVAADAPGTPAPAVDAPEGRLIVIAVDEHSIPAGAQASAREAVTRIVDRVSSADTLALVTFPGAVAVGPTRDHDLVRAAIGRVGGRRVDAPLSRFDMSAAEAVQVRARESVSTAELIQRLCAREYLNRSCPAEVREAASSIAHTLEQQGVQTIDALHGLLDHLQSIDGRKHLFVVSAGLPTTTVAGGQPNLTAATESVALRAAAANVNLYVFYLNVQFLQHFSPATGGRLARGIYQDINLFASGLERFADMAGGAFFQVEVDSDPFVDRAFRETSAFYRLAVRPDPSDAGARPRTIRVTVKQSGVTLRYRRVIEIPAATNLSWLPMVVKPRLHTRQVPAPIEGTVDKMLVPASGATNQLVGAMVAKDLGEDFVPMLEDMVGRLRFDRLTNYLRGRRPLASIGHSILVFRLSQQEVDDAVGEW